jgi:SAM-dependent methyltransferase
VLSGCELVVGTLSDLPRHERFDAILYMDVLEHIENDAAELGQAARRLERGGHLIVLAPAHQWLCTPFDRAIGHYRRYNAAMMRRLTPPETVLERLRYLDAAGICASLGNRLLLSSASPTVKQIKTWDGMLVPISRRLDPLLAYKLGKCVLAVWRSVERG